MYYISTGKKAGFYTLWASTADDDVFIQNLSTDWDKAIKKSNKKLDLPEDYDWGDKFDICAFETFHTGYEWKAKLCIVSKATGTKYNGDVWHMTKFAMGYKVISVWQDLGKIGQCFSGRLKLTEYNQKFGFSAVLVGEYEITGEGVDVPSYKEVENVLTKMKFNYGEDQSIETLVRSFNELADRCKQGVKRFKYCQQITGVVDCWKRHEVPKDSYVDWINNIRL